MVSLVIDGSRVQVPEGTTVLEAARSVDIAIPYFCYHPKLSIAGNCRVCAVEVKGAPNPVISCREVCRDGMEVQTSSTMALDARLSALEFILINHPLDCPVCDCAGECDLQDYYFAHSCKPSRFTEKKVKKAKALHAGPQVMLDQERCISCTRCVRFCEEVAGSHEIGLTGRGDHQRITAEGSLTNPYSLCTVDICPVGALTEKAFRFKKRVWLLDSAATVCTGCATGCNAWLDHEGGVPYRLRPRENAAVNGPWMCDAGRMTYQKLVSAERVLVPLLREGSGIREASWELALTSVAARLEGIKSAHITAVLSPHATLEELAAFSALFHHMNIDTVVMENAENDQKFGDTVLRDADRAPNTRGMKLFATQPFPVKLTCDTLIAVGTLSAQTHKAIAKAAPSYAVSVAAYDTPAWAHAVLPMAPIEEQEGTLINRTNRLQRTHEAYAPRGTSRTGWRIAADLARTMNIELPCESVRDAYQLAQKQIAALKDFGYENIEGDGVITTTTTV